MGRYVEYPHLIGNDPLIGMIFPGWQNDGAYNYYRQSLISIAPLGVSKLYQDGSCAERSRAITPREKECDNLIVPVCFSVSYTGYAPARMEPTYMILGESAGVAAAMAARHSSAVQSVDVTALRASLRSFGQIID